MIDFERYVDPETNSIRKMTINEAKSLLHDLVRDEGALSPAEEVLAVDVAMNSGVSLEYILTVITELEDAGRLFNSLSMLALEFSPHVLANSFAFVAAEKNVRSGLLGELIDGFINGPHGGRCSDEVAYGISVFTRNYPRHAEAMRDALIDEGVFGGARPVTPEWMKRRQRRRK